MLGLSWLLVVMIRMVDISCITAKGEGCELGRAYESVGC